MTQPHTTYKHSIPAITVIDDEFLPVTIEIKLGMDLTEMDPYHQMIAYGRIEYFCSTVLSGAILINRHNPLCDKLYEFTTTRIIEFWEDPFDQIIAMIIFYKISSIIDTAGNYEIPLIEDITIKCNVGAGLEFTYDAEDIPLVIGDDDKQYMHERGISSLWYHRDDLTTCDHILINEDGHEFISHDTLSWKDIRMTWNKKEAPGPIEFKENIKPFKPKLVKK